MLPLALVEYLHILLAFVFVAATLASHWNVLAARRTTSWAERAAGRLGRQPGPLAGRQRRATPVVPDPALVHGHALEGLIGRTHESRDGALIQ
jgi:hypothetical protein